MTSSPAAASTFVEDAVSMWGDTVYRVALSHTASRDDADDVYQDVFERLLHTSQSFASPEHLKAWLIRVTINRCHDIAKAHSRSRTDTLEDHVAEVSRKLALPPKYNQDPDDFGEGVSSAMRKLPPNQQEILRLFYQEGLSTDEIAHTVDTTPGAVRTQLYRGRKTLRRILLAGTAVIVTVAIGLVGLGNDSTSAPSDENSQAVAANFFALYAWGASSPAAAPSTVTPSEPMGVGWLHPQYWDPNYNPDGSFTDGPVTRTNLTCTTFNFDARCIGANISSITYEIQGEGAWLSYNGESPALACYFSPAKRIQVDYCNAEEAAASADLIINVVLPLEGELKQLYDKAEREWGSSFYWDIVVPAGYAKAAQALTGDALTITATFTDGSIQQKTYRINAVPDVEQKSQQLAQRIYDEWEQSDGRVSHHQNLPPLLTLQLEN